MNSEVDVNILVTVYNQRIATLTNQNILLEAKVKSLTQEFEKEQKRLIQSNIDLQKQLDIPEEDKYQEATTD